MTEPIEENPVADTAGEEDHSNPWAFAGLDADPPQNIEDADHGAVRTAASWRNCQASITLVNAINARWPNRDRTSDGTIGDAAHATRVSDHNPWVKDSNGVGVVRARDVDKDGVDAAWIVEQLRLLGLAGDRRLRNQGYVIFNRRITRPDFSGWAAYNGTNPHDHHFHVSFSLDQAGYDDTSPWAFLSGGVAPTPAPPPAPTPAPGRVVPAWTLPAGHYYGLITGPAKSHGGINASERASVKLIQQALQRWGYAPASAGWADGRFEQPTANSVAAWQRAHMPRTTFFGQVWADDWRKLLSR